MKQKTHRKAKPEKIPKLFRVIGRFDIIFSDISPEEYIEHLQSTPYYRYDIHMICSADIQYPDDTGRISHTSFAFKKNIKGPDLWAIGKIYTTNQQETLVIGTVGFASGIIANYLTLLIAFGVCLYTTSFSLPSLAAAMVWGLLWLLAAGAQELEYVRLKKKFMREIMMDD